MEKIIYAIAFNVLIIVTINFSAFAQPGALDPSFAGGHFITDIAGFKDRGVSVVIQSDQKIIVVGYSTNAGNNTDFALVRYNIDGTLDTAFDTDGKVTTDFANSNEYAYSVALQTDGKIVAAGFIYNGSDPDFALARYNINGSLDTTFGTSGKVTTNFGALTNDYGKSVVIQTDGKIIVAGYNNDGISFPLNNDFAAVRYNTNGSLDSSFNTTGKVTTDFGGIDLAYDVALQGNGKIVLAGKSGIPPINNYNFASLRYNSNGSLDNTYGNGGIDTTDYNPNDVANSVLIQPDGKIVLSGYDGAIGDFAVLRYDSLGNLDINFGIGGIVTTYFGSSLDYAQSAALQSNGKIVVAGYTNPVTLDFALARYNSNGMLDNTFDTDGKVTTDFGSSNDEGMGIAIQSDGKIVMVGSYWNGPNDDDFAIARYIGDATTVIGEIDRVQNMITVSPNPFGNTISIKGTAVKGLITVFDLMGKEILRQKSDDAETTIKSEIMSPGIYLLKYNNGDKTSNIRLIKL